MSNEVYSFEVNQKSFGQAVILNSHKIPVFVEFLGVWSGPCIAMDNIFSALAKEFSEKLIFAKVDVDEQHELVKTYKIENSPTVLVFKNGEIVRTEVGELKEPEIRELLKDFGIFHESDLIREQAREKHLAGATHEAISLLTEAIKSHPSNTRVVLDMVQIFIDIEELEQANALYARLPSGIQETKMGKALNGQLTFANLAAKTESKTDLLNKISQNENDFDAHFDLSVRLVSEYQYSEAADHLLLIISNSPEYKDGAAKEMLITITNMIEPVNNDLAKELRRRLASLLSL